MLKYANYDIVTAEVPDEISLAINISNCPCHCEGCHSQYLWEDIGYELTYQSLESLIENNEGITCICFMGGDIEPNSIYLLVKWIKDTYKNKYKIAWYSGSNNIPDIINDHLNKFDFIKIGSYIKELGGLNSDNTNQRFFKVEKEKENETDVWLTDITYKFKLKL